MDASSLPGRVVISERAHERVVAALAADALGVPARDARATVSDDAGRLAARVVAKGRVGPGSPPLLARIDETRRHIAEEGSRITGAVYGTVSVRITTAITDQRRVR